MDNMNFVKVSAKSYDDTKTALEAAVKKHKFGVLHVHHVGDTLRSKGVADFKEDVAVFEVCNPGQAAKVLSADMALCSALPCRIAVFTEKDKGVVKCGMMSPGAMMQMFPIAEENRELLSSVAKEVETLTKLMVEEAVAPAADEAVAK